MGYTDVTVIWDGAVSDEMTFTDDLAQDMLRFIAIVKSEARQVSEPVEIYTLHHDHEISECECVQFVTDHRPDWKNGELS